MITSKNAARRRLKDERKLAAGHRKPSPDEVPARIASVIGVCKRCGRRGLIYEGVCSGYRMVNNVNAPYQMRSTRCEIISDAKLDREDRLIEGRRKRFGLLSKRKTK